MFISRCKESSVLGEVVSIWAGHSLSGTITTSVYTHYTEEFQLREAEKVDYLKWNFGEEKGLSHRLVPAQKKFTPKARVPVIFAKIYSVCGWGGWI